jgi:heavy metal sensor kinase
MKWPIRVRLTAWYVALLAMILLVVGAFLLLSLRAGLIQGVNQNLNEDLAELSIDLQSQTFQQATSAMRTLPRRAAFAAQVVSPDGKLIDSTPDPVGRAPMLNPAQLAHAGSGSDRIRVTRRLGPERERFRVFAKLVQVTGHPPQVLVVARSLEGVDDSVTKLALLLLLAVPAAAVAAGAGGWLLAGTALHPVARLTGEAALISADRLSDRVAVPPARDELGRLATTLNAMLDRIERGVQQQQRLVADASHELRTPLAVMRSEIDVQLRAPQQLPPDVRGVLESVNEEIERMGRTLENLLILARIDEGRLDLLYAPQRLDRLVGEVTAKLRPMAHAKAIDLSVEGDGVEVLADGPRLELVITNLVDNALKYTGRGGAVRVRVWRREQDAGLTVSDTGPGIPKEDLPRLFDRFYRADAARSRAKGQGGSGLGLAICREIASAHGGRLWAESEPGQGASFSLAMPLPGNGGPRGSQGHGGGHDDDDGEGNGRAPAVPASAATVTSAASEEPDQ